MDTQFYKLIISFVANHYCTRLMKKIVFGLSMVVILFSASCKKEFGGLPENSWSIAGKTFTAQSVQVSNASNYISAADGKGSTLDFSFKSIPTSNADLTVNDVAYTNKEIAVRTILSGNIVYNSISSAGTFVLVRVNNGKYTLIANDLKFVNASNAKDTVLVSTHIVEQ